MTTPRKMILNAQQRVYVEADWGHEDWIWNGKYCGKKIHIKKDKKTDWISHRVKDKVLYVESGDVVLTYGWSGDLSDAVDLTLHADTAFHVPAGMFHQLKATTPAVFVLELSTHHNDKDVVTADSEDEDNDANLEDS